MSALIVLAALCGWFVLQLVVLGGMQQTRAQYELYGELRQRLVAQTASLGGAIEPGAPVALLSVPTLGLQQVVVEGTASGDLLAGPGHRRDTVLPGQVGVSIVYGRASTYGAPFRAVPSLQPGDGIQLTTAQGEFVYRVDGVRRAGDPLPAPLTSGGGRLTLVTAEGDGPLAALAPSRTVYVDATLQGTAVVGAPGRPAAIPDSERAMAGDPSVLPALALTLQGLLVAAVGAIVLRRHLPGRVLWVIAAPVLVALAWLAGGVAVQLLPNLL
ncbi:class E sortase [Cellulomonas sp.]|uniref:class E sortase n=1 Tax=Cellulomonas sp. TaxID=40001 RepID=UPI003BA88B6A